MEYLAAAYGVLWAISFALVFSMWWRQRKLAAEVRVLEQLVEDKLDPQK
jgi:uncharacterized membrane protein